MKEAINMLLLESKLNQEKQDRISRLNNLSAIEQRNKLLELAKDNMWEVHFVMLKKQQKDGKNFHFWTDKNTLVQRAEYRKNKVIKGQWGRDVIRYSIVKSGEIKRISGDFGTIINLLCEIENGA